MNGRETETYFKGHNLLRNTDAYMMMKFLCKLVRDDHYDPEGVTVSESIRGLLLIVTILLYYSTKKQTLNRRIETTGSQGQSETCEEYYRRHLCEIQRGDSKKV